jgi:hypothetical protein
MGAGYSLAYVNDFFGVIAIFLLIKQTAPNQTPAPLLLGMTALVAASPLMLVNRACFTVEAGGLLLLALAMGQKNTLVKAFLLGLAVLYNYKLALAGSILLGWDIWQAGKSVYLKKLKEAALGGIVPFLVVGVVFMLTNPATLWLRPLATYVGLIGRNANPQAAHPGFDLLFYPRYLFDWENLPLWAAGLAGLIIYLKKEKPKADVYLVLLWLVVGMFLPKAPRWLMPVAPLLGGYALYAWTLIPQKSLRWAGAIAVCLWGMWSGYSSITQQLYTGELSCKNRSFLKNLPDLALSTSFICSVEVSSQDTVHTVLSTLPYLIWGDVNVNAHRYDTIDIKRITKGQVLYSDGYPALSGFDDVRQRGNVDGNNFALGSQGFTYILAIPILWLEHAEYTGLTYAQTLNRWHTQRGTCNQIQGLRAK